MSVTKWRTGAFLAIVLVLVLAACGGSEDGDSEPTSPPPTEAPASVATPEPTQLPTAVEEQPAPTAEEQPVPTQEAEEAEVKIPFDVPIMEEAVDVVIMEETSSITYVMQETEIEDVIEFYQTSMVESGWENVTTSAVGLMATLVFESDQARTSVSLQANNIAKTVTVRLFIVEK
jgi:hypothetical protein